MAVETAFRSEERYTQAEFFDWLQERPRHDTNHYELLGGHIVMTPPAGSPHSSIEARVCAVLVQYVDARSLGVVHGSSAGFELPSGDTVEPDVSFVSAATLAANPPTPDGKFYRMVPDLVVEILSRTTARRDRIEKKRIYEKNAVKEYWIVSNRPREVTVYRLSGAGFAKPVHVMSGVIESRVLPGLAVPLSAIFGPG
jgi:Uma2 family endonuclease